ncbi:hypothetical protein H4R18_001403 [Coemansia javaensis]|uniref:WD40 repeat-like protein n=1 Tax=Coemansia javaensis TaxID=2761396 RepID=A0A9W8LLD6_9FUNG|nr:hypothetical protein H4R18_001403 [Coemansia javaensis]
MSSASPFYSGSGLTPDGLSPRKEICNYFSAYPVYSLAWSRREDRGAFRMALGSFVEEAVNRVQIVQLSPHHDPNHAPDRADFGLVAEKAVDYPLTKVLWQPPPGYGRADLLAGVGDSLYLWECEPTGEAAEMGLMRSALRTRAKLTTRADYAAPITSFDWNQVDPRLIITSSIDTTCTVWDVETQQAKTQLIAHDREVFDVAFVAGSQDVFASAGADGSIRMFDLRALEHSTILYEAPPAVATATAAPLGVVGYADAGGMPAARQASFTPPLLRLACNAIDHNYIATFALDSSAVAVIDVRSPGTPVMELKGHRSPVHAIAWSPTSAAHLCSAAADSRVLVWDIHQALVTRSHHQRNAVAAAAQARHLSRLAAKDDAAAAAAAAAGGLPKSPHASAAAHASAVQAAAQAAAAQANDQNPIQVAPSLTYAARLPVNSLAWHQTAPEWISIGLGNTVQTLRL